MKMKLIIEQLLGAYSFRVAKQGEDGTSPIDALNKVPLNALASNRVNDARNIIKPIVDNYFETFNKKQKEKQNLALEVTDRFKPLIGQDVTELNKQLNAELFEVERKINSELNELLKEEYELDIHQIKLSDLMIDPKGDKDDPANWHPFKGEDHKFLDWLIVDDIDVPEIEIEGLDEAVEESNVSAIK